MKKTSALALFALLALASCDFGGLRGNDHIVTQPLKVPGFANIDTSGGFQIEWQAGAPSASITTDENLLGFVEVRVRDNTLHARTTRPLRPSHSIKLILTSNARESARCSGAAKLLVEQLHGSKFYLQTSGAAKVIANGAVDELVADMTGASDLRAESLQVKTAQLSVTGAGDARVAVADSLKVSITGAGKVEYTGNPAQIEKHITGAGSIRKRD